MNSMKQSFSNKYFDWILMGISLIFSVIGMINLVSGFEYFTTYLLRITLFLASVAAFFSLVFGKINGERFSRIFVIVVLILPGILLLNQILIDLVFYSVNQPDLLQNPMLFLTLMVGIVMLYFTVKFSNQQESDRIKDYGILIIGIGVFTICYTLTRVIEPIIVSEQNGYPIWKTVIKSILGISILIIGFRIKGQKIKFSKGLTLVLILMSIFGLI